MSKSPNRNKSTTEDSIIIGSKQRVRESANIMKEIPEKTEKRDITSSSSSPYQQQRQLNKSITLDRVSSKADVDNFQASSQLEMNLLKIRQSQSVMPKCKVQQKYDQQTIKVNADTGRLDIRMLG